MSEPFNLSSVKNLTNFNFIEPEMRESKTIPTGTTIIYIVYIIVCIVYTKKPFLLAICNGNTEQVSEVKRNETPGNSSINPLVQSKINGFLL